MATDKEKLRLLEEQTPLTPLHITGVGVADMGDLAKATALNNIAVALQNFNRLLAAIIAEKDR